MADDDPFLLQDTPAEDWRKASNEPDLQLPLPPANGSEEFDGTMLFRRVPAGSFLMGRRANFADSEPVHRVRVREFWLGKFVVTQAQWRAVASLVDWGRPLRSILSPSHFEGDALPVEQVSWDDVQAWLKAWQGWLDSNPAALRKLVGLAAGFTGKVLVRLPCEAEWEYACRAGSRTQFWNGDGEGAVRQVGWIDANSDGRTHPVDEYVTRDEARHPIGLRGMHGNVWEWCSDVWHDRAYCERPWGWTAGPWEFKDANSARESRSLRGGSWLESSRCASSGHRSRYEPGIRNLDIGFRLCLLIDEAPGQTAEVVPGQSVARSLAVQMPRRVAHWRNRNTPGFWNWQQISADHVTKLVVRGPLKLEQADQVQLREEVAALADLKELCIWNIRHLDSLPTLPLKLRVLDLRGCDELETLGSISPEVQIVNLGGCERLQDFDHLGGPGLRMLHLDRCCELDSFILHDILRKSPNLEELTASRCDGLREIKYLPPLLRRLVLNNCTNLVALPDLSEHKVLTDIHIKTCKSLKILPGLNIDQGAGVQRLFAYGCESLREFNRFDVRPVHLGEGEDTNVAATFRTMARLWHEPADLVMGKVLLLGGGRCGKTTLAKAFQWHGMSDIERTQRPGLNPMGHSSYTHAIQFWRWKTQFNGPNRRDGEVHVWDFGGQEVYHNTHRMFASEGSVFLIATTSRAEHERRLQEDQKNECLSPIEAQQWNEQNEFREVRYWLDYLRSVMGIETVDALRDRLRSSGRRPQLLVQIVYTGSTGRDAAMEDLLAQSGPYRGLLEDPDSGLRVAVFDRAKPDGLMPILRWVQSSLGHVADAFGIRTLKLFKDMADRVAVELELEKDRSDPPKVGQRVLSFDEWEDWAERSVLINASGEEAALLRAEQATAAAQYLHRCGRIFWLGRKTARSSIILNHQWAADIIYSLFESHVANPWRNETGELISDDQVRRLLALVRKYKECNEDQRNRFLDILHDCRVCVHVGEGQWMAMQADLLPRRTPKLDEELVQMWESFQRTWTGDWVNHSFAIHAKDGRLLGHEDFRTVVRALVEERHRSLPKALCARESDDGGFGWPIQPCTNNAIVRLWDTGLQMELRSYGQSVEHADGVMIRVEWMPRMEQSADGSTTGGLPQFDGGIFVQLLTRDEERHGTGLRKFLRHGPLSGFGPGLDDQQDPRTEDLSKADMAHLRGHGQPGWTTVHGPRRPDVCHDVAISYRWSDWETVRPLVEALERANIHFYIDRQDEQRRLGQEDRRSRIMEIYDYLKRARMLIVVASDEYFERPQLESSRNLYCPVELADAVNGLAGYDSQERNQWAGLPPNRPDGNLLWVMGAGFDGNGLRDRIERVIEAYRMNVIQGRAGNPRDSKPQWESRETDAIHAADKERVNRFVDRVVGQTDLRFDSQSADWVSRIVGSIRAGLGHP